MLFAYPYKVAENDTAMHKARKKMVTSFGTRELLGRYEAIFKMLLRGSSPVVFRETPLN